MSYLLFPIFVTLFTSVMAVADVFQRILPSEKAVARSVVIQNRAVLVVLRIIGVRFSIPAAPEVSKDLPLIIIANHQSIFDIPLSSVVFGSRMPGFIAKKELGRGVLGTSAYLRTGYNALVDRQNASSALKAIIKLGKSLKSRKGAVVLFPEGTRNTDGKLAEFKTAGFETLVRTLGDAVVVNLAISGSWRLNSKPIPFGSRVTVTVSEPVKVSSECNLSEVLQNSRDWIKKYV